METGNHRGPDRTAHRDLGGLAGALAYVAGSAPRPPAGSPSRSSPTPAARPRPSARRPTSRPRKRPSAAARRSTPRSKQARRELREQERRLEKRADLLDQKLELINKKERDFESVQRYLAEQQEELNRRKRRRSSQVLAEQRDVLHRIAQLGPEEARDAPPPPARGRPAGTRSAA